MRTLAVSFATCGCPESSGDPIHFVLPDGYCGPLKIIDAAAGAGYRHDGTRHIYTVRPSGVLHAPIEPFARWHKESAPYAGGDPIYSIEPGPPGPESIRIRGLGATGDGELWTVVGSESEIDRWQQMWNEHGARMLEAELPAESERPNGSRPMLR